MPRVKGKKLANNYIRPSSQRLIHKKRLFHCNKVEITETEKKLRVRCINSSAAKGGCKVAGYIIGEDRNGIWHLNGEEHTCELNENLELEIDFRYALYQACIAEKGGDREQIYDRVVKQGFEKVSGTLTKHRMKSSMKRWLALDIIEGKPKNLKETNEAINKKKGLKYEKGKITSEYIKGKDKEGKEYEILIMKSEELMKLIFSRKDKEVFEVFVDGTFRVVPKRIKGKQFVTISILYHGHVIPIMWALMSRKTKAAYEALFAHLKSILPSNIVFKSLMSDFEFAIGIGAKKAFPKIKLYKCHFHYCQAIYKKALKLGIIKILNSFKSAGKKSKKKTISEKEKELRADAYEIIHGLMSLALLPHDKIAEGFTFIQKLAKKMTQPNDLLSYKLLVAKIQKLLTYFDEYWMQKVRPKVFSVYKVGHKTDNFLESYHKQLNSKMPKNPTPKKFLTVMKDFIARLHKRLVDHITTGSPLSSGPKNIDVAKEHIVFQLQKQIKNKNRLTVPEFISQAAILYNKQLDYLDILGKRYPKYYYESVDQENVLEEDSEEEESELESDNEDPNDYSSESEDEEDLPFFLEYSEMEKADSAEDAQNQPQSSVKDREIVISSPNQIIASVSTNNSLGIPGITLKRNGKDVILSENSTVIIKTSDGKIIHAKGCKKISVENLQKLLQKN